MKHMKTKKDIAEVKELKPKQKNLKCIVNKESYWWPAWWIVK